MYCVYYDCDVCGYSKDAFLHIEISKEKAAEKAIRHGWYVNLKDDKWICPECVKRMEDGNNDE